MTTVCQLARSPKRMMPIGMSRTGVSETMNSALADRGVRHRVKNRVMLMPKAIAGHQRAAQLVGAHHPPLLGVQHDRPDDAGADHPPERHRRAGDPGLLDQRAADAEQQDGERHADSPTSTELRCSRARWQSSPRWSPPHHDVASGAARRMSGSMYTVVGDRHGGAQAPPRRRRWPWPARPSTASWSNSSLAATEQLVGPEVLGAQVDQAATDGAGVDGVARSRSRRPAWPTRRSAGPSSRSPG